MKDVLRSYTFLGLVLVMVMVMCFSSLAFGATFRLAFLEAEDKVSSSQFNRQCKTINTLDLFTEKVTKQS